MFFAAQLENLGKMVIMTGSMLPLSDLFNDAQRNLLVSLVMASTLDLPEVCVFMDSQLLRGNRTVKSNSSGLDAFVSPNYPALGHLEIGVRVRAASVLPHPKGRFRVHRDLDANVAVWRMIPGFDDEYIANSIQHSQRLRAIVLELYGTGNMSSRKQSLLDALSAAIAKGIIIVAVSQCHRGTVDLRAYALGRKLEAIGVISGLDMTTEAVCTKLAYLLSWPGMTPEQVRRYMGRSLRGEVTESTHTSASALARGYNRVGDDGEIFITMDSISKAAIASRGGESVSGRGGGGTGGPHAHGVMSTPSSAARGPQAASAMASPALTAAAGAADSPAPPPMPSLGAVWTSPATASSGAVGNGVAGAEVTTTAAAASSASSASRGGAAGLAASAIAESFAKGGGAEAVGASSSAPSFAFTFAPQQPGGTAAAEGATGGGAGKGAAGAEDAPVGGVVMGTQVQSALLDALRILGK